MSDTPIQLDPNELIADFARENAALAQRAVMAEAGNRQRDRIIDALSGRVAELQGVLEARELLDEAAADDEARETEIEEAASRIV